MGKGGKAWHEPVTEPGEEESRVTGRSLMSHPPACHIYRTGESFLPKFHNSIRMKKEEGMKHIQYRQNGKAPASPSTSKGSWGRRRQPETGKAEKALPSPKSPPSRMKMLMEKVNTQRQKCLPVTSSAVLCSEEEFQPPPPPQPHAKHCSHISHENHRLVWLFLCSSELHHLFREYNREESSAYHYI